MFLYHPEILVVNYGGWLRELFKKSCQQRNRVIEITGTTLRFSKTGLVSYKVAESDVDLKVAVCIRKFLAGRWQRAHI
jgi:hypothetical protein